MKRYGIWIMDGPWNGKSADEVLYAEEEICSWLRFGWKKRWKWQMKMDYEEVRRMASAEGDGDEAKVV